ncbi:hypothetical protein ASF10_12040 [Flavobacterium sp. Leaf82]|jgi:uncharacterized protein (DUF433 family)|uniref:DUF433 domain-containing protein n=1 Tax=unclassified Flavobacterium TaxID=196869 RepID=UPI0006F4EC40|nr:DUF433 domain-containing protein [Flavobacterium sp. Leaf82]KQO21481.1 hypothetical protein ASF10_12040 [Flavobacterium sp. Leaf82]
MINNWQTFISINPDIRFGKPVITGTRICVSDILSWLATGMSFEEIIEDFPELNKEHILAALAFAANRENITKIIAA